MRSTILLSLLLLLAAGTAAAQDKPPRVVLYTGMCEASGAVPLDAETFAVVDDDKEELRIYRKGRATQLDAPKLSKAVPEVSSASDLEGGTKIGQDFYWIGSHSRNNDGEEKPKRHRLFAVRIKGEGDKFSLEPVGKAYAKLLDDLAKDSRFAKYQLACAANLAPEEPGALNIEGLSATPDGKLLIGFRNPVRQGKALIVTLDNPREVLDGKPPIFGDPIELDLEGLGIRSMEFWPVAQQYVIIAGSSDAAGRFQAYLWSGNPADPPTPRKDVNFRGLIPEAFVFDSRLAEEGANILGAMIALSDEGDACFDPEAFRSLRIPLKKP